jgi:hypothetical protein
VQDATNTCGYLTSFTVPDAPPGAYTVLVLSGDTNGWASMPAIDLTITG